MEILVITKGETKFPRATIAEAKEYLEQQKKLGFDTETTGLHPIYDKVLLIQLGTREKAFVIDCTTVDASPLLPILTNSKILKVGHNLKFDYKMMKGSFGIDVAGMYDTMVVDQVIYNGLFQHMAEDSKRALGMYRAKFSLKATVKRHLGLDIEADKKLGKSFINHTGPFSDAQYKYAAHDIGYPLDVMNHQIAKLKEYQLGNVSKLECDLIPAIGDMEFNGIKINREGWINVIKKTEIELDKVVAELDAFIEAEAIEGNPKIKKYVKNGLQMDLFGGSMGRKVLINWASPVQVAHVLKSYGLVLPDTKALTLQENQDEPIVASLLKFRGHSKTLSSYGYSFLEKVDKNTNRVHTNFNQVYPETGRLSSEDPNLQNIKRDSEFRGLFIAEDGHVLITADYTGQELALIAEASQDPTWVKALRNGEDLHSRVTSMLYPEYTYEQIVDAVNDKKHPKHDYIKNTLRYGVKTVNFGLAYGMSAKKLSQTMKWSFDEADAFIKRYFLLFPGVAKFLREQGNFAKENGYSTTFPAYNRVRWFKDYEDAVKAQMQHNDYRGLARIERQGKNNYIQGTGADMVKKALTEIRRKFKQFNIDAKLILTVHDEIVCQCRKQDAEYVKVIVQDTMTETAAIFIKSFPLTVTAEISEVWQK